MRAQKSTKTAKTTDTATPFVKVENFGITFAGKTIIRDLSFEVQKGEIFGLLGSNGSGKTTTIRALLGLYEPDQGSLTIDGAPFSPNTKRPRATSSQTANSPQKTHITVGYLPEERGLYKKETVYDTMLYFAKLKRLKKPKIWIKNYLSRVGLADNLKSKVDQLSQGMQQKVQLGITIMNNPDLLILDEPTKGFDPVNRRLLMQIIHELHEKGTTIILITHYMDEVERLCDHILLLKDGIAHAYGTVKDVKSDFDLPTLDDIFLRVYGANTEHNHNFERITDNLDQAPQKPKGDY
ncbi:ATP-binding cassette domain-containing protein [Candidatus Saccharibacteria bacterium]|nr:ATP-binding cassette domain-containing protein [Candidatus Saccharibacteria bacterium]